MQSKCVCGHYEGEHEEVKGEGLVCFHEERPGVITCQCMQFESAEQVQELEKK